MAVTLRDIARKAGVHPSTVSRILQNNRTVKIAEETRERIIAIAREMDYQPNELARAFRLRKTLTIGLIIPDISNSFFSGISHSIEMQIYDAGYNLVVCNTNENMEKERKYVRNLLNRGVDGMIIASCQNDEAYLGELKQKNFPFVLIDRVFDNLDSNCVFSDNRESAFAAVMKLKELGHRRIGFLRGRSQLSTIKLRLQGYREAIHEFGLDSEVELIAGDGFTVEEGYLATKNLLTLQKPPTAMLTSGNRLLIGAMQAIKELQVKMPDQLSLIAYTDDLFSPYLACPLTTISHPLSEMGKSAVDLLMQKINRPEEKSTVKIKVNTKFSQRESLAACR